jgi:adenine-specific DNA-methyltransferase
MSVSEEVPPPAASDKPTRVEVATPDLAAAKRAALEELFPGVLVDGVLDAARLGELLDTPVTAPAEGRERFGLMWAGKQDAVRSLLTPSHATLIPEESSVDFDTAQNVFIEGDSLEVLKLLQKAYNDKVKLIYIDPPYNTGTNTFIYPDDFTDSLRAYLEYTGQTGPEGNRTSASADVLGRRHSRWLSMMYPRLILARNLLVQDGVIFVSIDDNEVANLRELMDEVFGSENFVATVIWQKVYSPKNTARHFSEDHDYIVVYARNAELWSPNALPRTADQDKAYRNPDNDPRGPWKPGGLDARNFYSKGTYAITTPSGRVIKGPPAGAYWRVSKEKFDELDADGRIWWGADGNNIPAIKRYLTEVKQGRVPQTFWPYTEVGHNQDAKKQLLQRVEFASSDSVFDTPKPTQLIRRMLTLATTAKDSHVVLDFFAGSGSTADAVLQQNAEDGGNRTFISIQLPQPTGYDDYKVVSDITRARMAAAMEEVGTAQGLRSYKLGASNFRDVSADASELFDLNESTLLVDEAVVDDIAAEVLLKEGVPLNAPWERHKAGEADVIVADGVAVVVSTDVTDGVVTDALALEPRVLVFLEDGFAGSDAVKANAFTNARNLGITMKTV